MTGKSVRERLVNLGVLDSIEFLDVTNHVVWVRFAPGTSDDVVATTLSVVCDAYPVMEEFQSPGGPLYMKCCVSEEVADTPKVRVVNVDAEEDAWEV